MFTFPSRDGSGVHQGLADADPREFGCEEKGSFVFFVPISINSSVQKKASYAEARAKVAAMGGNTIIVKTEYPTYDSGWATAFAWSCPLPKGWPGPAASSAAQNN